MFLGKCKVNDAFIWQAIEINQPVLKEQMVYRLKNKRDMLFTILGQQRSSILFERLVKVFVKLGSL